MNIQTAIAQIEKALTKMEKVTNEPLFDEWALVEKCSEKWRLIEYRGPRKEAFISEFKVDLAALKSTLDLSNTYVGDSAFSHEGHGSGFDAHMCVGTTLFLLFNNTEKNTDEITRHPKWTQAQVHFAELLESFIADPVA